MMCSPYVDATKCASAVCLRCYRVHNFVVKLYAAVKTILSAAHEKVVYEHVQRSTDIISHVQFNSRYSTA